MLIIKGEVQQKPNTRFTRELRNKSDFREDHKRLASDILIALDTRVNSVMSDNSLAVLQVFDAAALVKLHCGIPVELAVSDGDYDAYGVKECEAVLAVASKMPNVRESGMDLDPKLGHRYMGRIKEAVMAGIWKSLCPEWFVSQDKYSTPLQSQDSDLVLFESVSSDKLDALFRLKFVNGNEFKLRLHEQNFYASFYSKEEIYQIANLQIKSQVNLGLQPQLTI